MRIRWPALVALTTANVALIIGSGLAVGSDQTKVPTQFEIERLLKTRGLPTAGAAPAQASGTALHPETSAAGPRITFQTITFEFASAALTRHRSRPWITSVTPSIRALRTKRHF